MKLRTRVVSMALVVLMLVGAPWAMTSAVSDPGDITISKLGICIPLWHGVRVCI